MAWCWWGTATAAWSSPARPTPCWRATRPPCARSSTWTPWCRCPENWSSRHDEATRTARTAAARASGLNALPPPDPSGFGLSGPDREWLMRRQGPHPFNAYQEPLFFDADRVAAVPRTFIDCVSPAYPTIAPIRQRVRQTPGFSVVEMATGHYPQIQDPVGFVQLLRSVFVR